MTISITEFEQIIDGYSYVKASVINELTAAVNRAETAILALQQAGMISPGTDIQSVGDANNQGAGANYARSNHVHKGISLQDSFPGSAQTGNSNLSGKQKASGFVGKVFFDDSGTTRIEYNNPLKRWEIYIEGVLEGYIDQNGIGAV